MAPFPPERAATIYLSKSGSIYLSAISVFCLAFRFILAQGFIVYYTNKSISRYSILCNKPQFMV
jgi:hypothetical protein